MKKIVISGSSKLQDKIKNWVEYFSKSNYKILDYPKPIDEKNFIDLYPNIHKNFYESITKTDILFIMNEDKNGITGYIGSAAFAEMVFGIAQKLIYNKKLEIIILKMPSANINCYDEINLYLKLGWIKLYKEEKI